MNPKSIETVMSELEQASDYIGEDETRVYRIDADWLRSAIASVVLHAAESAKPQKFERQVVGHSWNIDQPDTYYGQCEQAVEYYNNSTNDFSVALRSYAEKILKGE